MTIEATPTPTTLWHTTDSAQVVALLNSDRQSGLTTPEVKQRQQQYGLNELIETGGRSSWAILLDQFKNIMLIMLIAVAVISGLLDFLDWRAGELPCILNIQLRNTI